MERIKQALDKARKERESRQTHAGEAVPGGEFDGETTTETVTLDISVLRENRVVAGLEPGTFTDANNLLRTQILQRFRKNNWNVLAITSPGNAEGKTLTAINLAISIAREVDYTVLLVDANLRHPWMLDHFGLPHRRGLSEYLTENTPLSELLIKPNLVDHLVILPGGKPLTNSAEMLNSPRMGKLVEEMKNRYPRRIVIFDLPPVLTTADALAFAPYVDATLLVVEDGKTRRNELKNAASLLDKTNLIGTVLNKAESVRK